MRGLPGRYLPAESERRITPAYAGSVHCALPTRTGPADHPRIRGAQGVEAAFAVLDP